MIGYVTLGTTNLQRAGNFYDDLLGSIGAGRFMEEADYFIAWAKSDSEPSIAVTMPFNKEPATVGNGTMVAMAFETPEQVSSFYHKAIELGAT